MFGLEKNNKNIKVCLNCSHCIYIGESNYICDADNKPVLVMEEHCPNDNYWYCAGIDWESDGE